jgi:hydroxymethylpyrimidine pyrophosphatase-like HAD family hydrolase
MGRRTVRDATELLRGIEVIYTDLDGTMLGRAGSFLHDRDGLATLEPAEALLGAQAAGIDVVPTSGRTLRGLQTDARLLGMSTVIAEMGALTSYRFGEEVVTLLGETPEGEDRDEPAKMMERVGAIRALFDAYADRLEHHLPWATWRSYTQLFRGSVDPGEVDAMLADRGFAWLQLHDNGRLHGDYLGLGHGGSRAYHLMPRGMSKAAAVAADLERRGIDPMRAVAIGDAHADLLFAEVVGLCVIVGDALEDDPVLTARCDALENVVVTEAPQNLGWAELLRVCADGR